MSLFALSLLVVVAAAGYAVYQLVKAHKAVTAANIVAQAKTDAVKLDTSNTKK